MFTYIVNWLEKYFKNTSQKQKKEIFKTNEQRQFKSIYIEKKMFYVNIYVECKY